jgi:Tol biopolymer transport system component
MGDLLDSLEASERPPPGQPAFGHGKVAPGGARIFQVVRVPPPLRRGPCCMLFTFGADGRDVRCAVGWRDWARGGHHPARCPDGDSIVMNLDVGGRLRFVRMRHDGTQREVLPPGGTGSGHPTLHASSRFLLTDAYQVEAVSGPGPEIPVRLFDLSAGRGERLCSVEPMGGLSTLALDLHPVWSRDGRAVCFNGAPGGRRAVFVADLSTIVDAVAGAQR